MELVTENKAVQREAAALHDICEAEGAFFHDKLRMVVTNDGDMWLESTLPADQNDVLISLPDSCLPRIDPVTFKLVGDDIEIESIADGALGDTQERCLKHMLAIYNATGKVTQHRESSPWFALADAPDLLDAIVAGRRGAPRLEEKYQRIRDEGLTDDFLIEDFLGTRKYGALEAPTLMPFIDYANHDPRAPAFQPAKRVGYSDHQVAILNSQPAENGGEVRVRYSQLDALDSFLNYGFVDTSTNLVRSCPLTIDIEVGEIVGESRIGAKAKKKRPEPGIKDLRGYLPMILENADGRITVTHLLLPEAGSPFALRRILNWLIRKHDPDLGLKRMGRLVDEAERRILDANRAFYDDLQASLDAADQVPTLQSRMLTDLIRHQREAMDAYVERLKPAEEPA